MKRKGISEWIYENRLVLAIFLFSTAFFLWQRSTGFSWDFATYVLNAKFLAGSGFYYEWTRQPLPSFMILSLSFLGWALAEYAYIIVVSILYLYSSLVFARKTGIDRTLFYAFSMNAYALVFGLKLGSELLSLALLQLFIAHLYDKRAGIYAGLSFLARYSNLNFLLFLLAPRNARKIALAIILFALVISPWLYFNYAETGSPVTSIRDSYMLNVVFRRLDGYISSFSYSDLLFSLNLLLPLMIAGIARLFSRKSEYDVLMLGFLAVAVVSYALIPFKEERYMFPITLPAAYFAAKGAEARRSGILLAFVIATLALLFILLPAARNEPSYFYRTVSTECMAQSNAWVALNYYGTPSEPYPNQEQFGEAVEDGYRIIFFKHAGFPLYMNNRTFMQRFPVIEENEGYVMYGDASKCKEPANHEMLFMDRIARRIEDGDIACDLLSCRYLK